MKNRFHKFLALCMTAILAVAFLSLPVSAAVPDRPSNQYVLDSAGVISDATEKEIVSKNKALFQETGAEIVIAAVDFLDGKSIDDYAYDLFSDWGIGSSERDNGVLLVMAVAEDNYYALPGYGIEDHFSGSHLQGLLDDYVEPGFAEGDYDKAASQFFSAVYEELEDYSYNDEYDSYRQGGTHENYGGYESYDTGFSFGRMLSMILWFIVRIVIVIVIVVVVLALIRSISGGGGGGNTGGGGGGFWRGMFIGNLLGGRRRRWYGVPPPPPPGGFGPGPRPPRGHGGFGGFGGGGGFHGGGGASRGGGGFHGGGGSRGGGAGRR